MKNLFLLTALLLLRINCFSQDAQQVQDPEAGRILEKIAVKMRSMTSLQADYSLIIKDRKENKETTSSGSLLLKNNKYKLTSEGSTVFYDGTTMWTYSSSANEVTITEPEKESSDFLSDPFSFFNTYKANFKYRYVKEVSRNGIPCHEIELFPKNLNQPYSRIRIYASVSADLPEVVESIGKDGIDYIVTLKNKKLNQEVPDATFVFDKNQYKKVEIVDLRGL